MTKADELLDSLISEEIEDKKAQKRLDAFKDVVENGAKKIDGVLVDSFTASAVIQIYNKLSPEKQEKLMQQKASKIAAFVWKVVGRNS